MRKVYAYDFSFDREADHRKYFATDSGIMVLAKGAYTPELSRYQ